MAVFRTLVRHRTVKAVFLSEAKILSSDFTFIVNIISRFVVCTLIPDTLATLDLMKGPDVPVMTAMDRATTPTP